ncbi:unnamed protein product [Prunus armeniaca]
MRACRSAREVSENSTHACVPFGTRGERKLDSCVPAIRRERCVGSQKEKNGEGETLKCRRKWGGEGAWAPLCMGDTCRQGCEELQRFGSRCEARPINRRKRWYEEVLVFLRANGACDRRFPASALQCCRRFQAIFAKAERFLATSTTVENKMIIDEHQLLGSWIGVGFEQVV